MSIRNRITGTVVLSLLCISSLAQDLSNKGKEFYVGYGHHQFFETGANSQGMVLYLSAEQAATVTVSIDGTGYSQVYNVPANSVISTAQIPKSGPQDARLFDPANLSEGIFNKGIRISSNVPIVAYSHIYGSTSSGATMLMPTNTWGYAYQSINSRQRYATNCFSWFYVVAKENNTVIEVTPSVPTRGGKPANVPFTVTLNKGQIYQIMGALTGGSDGHEMTGTKVRSIANSNGDCHPIAAFSGSSRTSNPSPCLTATDVSGGGDNDMQQLFPSQAWGKRYLLAPTSTSSSASSYQINRYKIVVSDPNTVVKRNGFTLPQASLVNNTYYTFESQGGQEITSDKPVMVAQFMNGASACLGGTGNNGDPEMIIISPVEQGIKRIGFYKNYLQAITSVYLTMIIHQNGLNSLTIDGQAYPGGFSHSFDHPVNPNYKVVIKRWTMNSASAGQCIVQSDSAFTAITYGMGSVESYGYNAGTNINNLNVLGSLYNTPDPTQTSHDFTCINTPIEISMGLSYAPTTMTWQLSQVPNLSPNADVTVSNPVPAFTSIQNGITYYHYTLPGTYTFSDTGTYVIPVRNSHPSLDNCNNSEVVSFALQVKEKPKVDFSFMHTGCVRDSVHFTASAQTMNGYDINSWKWSFEDATELTEQNPVKLFTATGPQNVNLEIVTAQGCLGDTTKTLDIEAPPTATVASNTVSFCEGNGATLTGTPAYSGTGTVNYYWWDFGNGSTANPSVNDPQTTTYPSYGSYTVKYVVGVSPTCVSDTAMQVIDVYAKPSPSFEFSEGCLPSDGIVQFTNTSTVPDNQTMTYSWDFGDANATPGNPNTSTDENPTHNFALGTYSIKLTVTTANGCSKDTTITTTFNVSPDVAYTPLTSVCESIQGTVSVASGTVTNGVSGTGIYKGTGVDNQGNFSPSVAGPGIHTIWYVFTSNGGCKDSVSSTIKVHPKPVSNFTVTSVCNGELSTFTDASTISSGNITGWNWNFGDGNSASYNDSDPFTRAYTSANQFTVKLVTVSDSSCVSDTAFQTVNIYPVPEPDFTMPAFICMPNGNAVFNNTSSIQGNGNMSYVWNFGDGSATSTASNPSHVYATSGPFNVQLTASTADGCEADITKVLDVFYDKPIANFTVNPDVLCQGNSNSFTDNSTAPNSDVASWSWSFGDGSTSTEANPSKTYSAAGDYEISLTVKNTVGCTSDPFKDSVKVFVQPVIDAGPNYVVPEGTIVKFNPTVNDSTSVSFLWTPSGDFPDPTILRPTLLVNHNQTYTLTATGDGNCTATDTMRVQILKLIDVPNSFSPNGDGINDQWVIPNLSEYPGNRVEVYNRYGQIVFQSNGYGQPWDGTRNGSPVPFATYYYIITLNNGFAPVTGSVTVVR